MIRGLLIFLLILTSIHIGYTFASPVIKNKMLEGKMKEVAKASAMQPESQIRREVMAFINEKNIPLSENQLVIQQRDKKLTIAAYYTAHAEFWFYDRDYEFYPASHKSARLAPVSRAAQTERGRRQVRAGH